MHRDYDRWAVRAHCGRSGTRHWEQRSLVQSLLHTLFASIGLDKCCQLLGIETPRLQAQGYNAIVVRYTLLFQLESRSSSLLGRSSSVLGSFLLSMSSLGLCFASLDLGSTLDRSSSFLVSTVLLNTFLQILSTVCFIVQNAEVRTCLVGHGQSTLGRASGAGTTSRAGRSGGRGVRGRGAGAGVGGRRGSSTIGSTEPAQVAISVRFERYGHGTVALVPQSTDELHDCRGRLYRAAVLFDKVGRVRFNELSGKCGYVVLRGRID